MSATDDQPAPDDAVLDRLTPAERHRRRMDADMHPRIGFDDIRLYSARMRRYDDDRPGVYIDDPDRLIGVLERDRCPVCGETGTLQLAVGQRPTFTRGAKYRRSPPDGDPGDAWEMNPTTEAIKDSDWGVLSCRASDGDRIGNTYYLGLASPNAVEEWREWDDSRGDRNSFRKTARQLADPSADTSAAFNTSRFGTTDDFRHAVHDSRFGHGHLIAALYLALGCEEYDPRDLMGRSHVTKRHLAVLLDRARMLEWSEPGDETEDEWLQHRNFGITDGGVAWHVPEWAGFDGLRYSDRLRTEVFPE